VAAFYSISQRGAQPILNLSSTLASKRRSVIGCFAFPEVRARCRAACYSLLSIPPSRSCGSLPAGAFVGRSTLRPYWLGRARWLVRLRASSSAVVWEPGCAILQPFVGSTGNGPCGLTLPLQHGTRICHLKSEISDRSKSTATSPGRLLCSSSDACAVLHVRRQAEPSASREVLVPYSVHQPRCVGCPVRPALGRSRFGVGIFLC
jgi:hypothetical protein